jgi:hypothetical protein
LTAKGCVAAIWLLLVSSCSEDAVDIRGRVFLMDGERGSRCIVERVVVQDAQGEIIGVGEADPTSEPVVEAESPGGGPFCWGSYRYEVQRAGCPTRPWWRNFEGGLGV